MNRSNIGVSVLLTIILWTVPTMSSAQTTKMFPFPCSKAHLPGCEECDKWWGIMFKQLTQAPNVSIAMMDAAVKHPAIAGDTMASQTVMTQRRIVVGALAAKEGKFTVSDSSIEDCVEIGLGRCIARGWDRIFDAIGDGVSKWCEKHPDKC